ncbi:MULTISPECIES: hypothetical protein [unclassified Mesorhizobium]|uniref:hypothetical protein n=1 Tax=unclassified Mesorhizobium TaxID=325217 RepID=UPI0012EB58B8|nr:hypothetical protein [Mesorhizobium sp. LSJC255A00]
MSSRQVFNPGYGAARHAGLNSPSWGHFNMTSQATTIDRRHLLVGLASLPAIAGAVALAPPATIPSDLMEKIKAWQAALAALSAAHDAYSASLRAKPIDKTVCNRLFQTLLDAGETSRWHRDEMMTALAFLDQERVS